MKLATPLRLTPGCEESEISSILRLLATEKSMVARNGSDHRRTGTEISPYEEVGGSAITGVFQPEQVDILYICTTVDSDSLGPLPSVLDAACNRRNEGKTKREHIKI